jgi:DNA-binding LacI/PurR family transcriptional regulator
MPQTIKDVAALAGFSIATVSRAINAPHTVSPATLAAIRTAIDTLQFRPSPLGRQLRGERTRLVGVVVPTIANPVFADCLQGIDELATAAGFKLILMTTEYDAARERHAIETLREQRVEGLILTVADADTHPLLDMLDRDGPHYVLMHNDTQRRPSVSVDNRRAAYDGVRLLTARGHRRVLMLAGSLAASDRARQRHLGYAQALAEADVATLPPVEVDFNAAELPDAVLAHLTARATRPTALFCSNDLLAMVVMRPAPRGLLGSRRPVGARLRRHRNRRAAHAAARERRDAEPGYRPPCVAPPRRLHRRRVDRTHVADPAAHGARRRDRRAAGRRPANPQRLNPECTRRALARGTRSYPTLPGDPPCPFA